MHDERAMRGYFLEAAAVAAPSKLREEAARPEQAGVTVTTQSGRDRWADTPSTFNR